MKHEFNIKKNYTKFELDGIEAAFEFAERHRSKHFPCFNLNCHPCPFNVIENKCGGTSRRIGAKYGKNPDWSSIRKRWEQEVLDYSDDRPTELSIDKFDAKVLSDYIRCVNETLVIPDEMKRVSERVKRLIDESFTYDNKGAD